MWNRGLEKKRRAFMKSKLVALTVLAIGSVASAALPPYEQRFREIEAVIKLDTTESAVTAQVATSRGGSGVVDGVTWKHALRGLIGGNVYLVKSGTCELAVTVQYDVKPGLAGPPELKLTAAKEMSCPKR